MRAIVYPGEGGIDALSIVNDEPDPHAEGGKVLIEVALCGVNYADGIGLRTGNNFLGSTRESRIPGGEVVGRRLDTGQRVVAICGSGGFAQRVAAPAGQIFPVPEDVGDETALALFIQGLTAWHIVGTLGHLAPRESVLVHSAAGGVGLLALQIAKATGAASIVATASTSAKRELALATGATGTVSADVDGLADRAIEANGGRRFDLVLDRSGGDVFAQSVQATGPLGRIVCYGTSSGQPGQVTTGVLIAGSRTVSGFWLMDFLRDAETANRALDSVYALHRRGKLEARIGMVLPLGQAADALRAIASRETVGKVLLDPRGKVAA
jgi:NADPH2:quinone reductase